MSTLELLPPETHEPPLVQAGFHQSLEAADTGQTIQEPSEWFQQMQAELADFEASGFADLTALHLEPDPFRHGRVSVNFSSFHEIETFRDKPNYIIRKWAGYNSPEQRQRGVEYAKTLNTMLRGLQTDYGIQNSGVAHVISKDPSGAGEMQYLITNRVDGISVLDNLKRVPEAEIVGLMTNLIQHYTKAAKHGGTYARDLSLRQFMYGKLPKDADDKLYLVDLETAIVGSYDPNHPDSRSTILQADLETLGSDVLWMEEAYGHDFPDLREAIQRVYKQIPPEPLYYSESKRHNGRLPLLRMLSKLVQRH